MLLLRKEGDKMLNSMNCPYVDRNCNTHAQCSRCERYEKAEFDKLKNKALDSLEFAYQHGKIEFDDLMRLSGVIKELD